MDIFDLFPVNGRDDLAFQSYRRVISAISKKNAVTFKTASQHGLFIHHIVPRGFLNYRVYHPAIKIVLRTRSLLPRMSIY